MINFLVIYLEYIYFFFKNESTSLIFLPELEKFYYNIKKHFNYNLINEYKKKIIGGDSEYNNIIDINKDVDLIECLIYAINMLICLNK